MHDQVCKGGVCTCADDKYLCDGVCVVSKSRTGEDRTGQEVPAAWIQVVELTAQAFAFVHAVCFACVLYS